MPKSRSVFVNMKSKSLALPKKVHDDDSCSVLVFTPDDLAFTDGMPFRFYVGFQLAKVVFENTKLRKNLMMIFYFFCGKRRDMINSSICPSNELELAVMDFVQTVADKWKKDHPEAEEEDFDKFLVKNFLKSGGICVYTATSNDADKLDLVSATNNMPLIKVAMDTAKNLHEN